MGTDCKLIAKTKDGKYKIGDLDRFYVFSGAVLQHMDLFTKSGIECDSEGIYRPSQKFELEWGIQWAEKRLQTLNKLLTNLLAGNKQPEEECIDIDYHIFWISNFNNYLSQLKLFTALYNQQLDWVGVFDEHHAIYEQVIFNVDKEDKIELIKFLNNYNPNHGR